MQQTYSGRAVGSGLTLTDEANILRLCSHLKSQPSRQERLPIVPAGCRRIRYRVVEAFAEGKLHHPIVGYTPSNWKQRTEERAFVNRSDSRRRRYRLLCNKATVRDHDWKGIVDLIPGHIFESRYQRTLRNILTKTSIRNITDILTGWADLASYCTTETKRNLVEFILNLILSDTKAERRFNKLLPDLNISAILNQ